MSVKVIPLGSGKCSEFGGPNDDGVGRLEPLSCVGLGDLSEDWFGRCFGPISTGFGLARTLKPASFYCAMRWAYGTFEGQPGEILPGVSRSSVRRALLAVTNAEGKTIFVQAVDWGPNPDTDRLIDLSPGAMAALDLATNDLVSVDAILPDGVSANSRPQDIGSKGEQGAPGVQPSGQAAAPGSKEAS
jgi:hypothetical protein